MSIILFGQYPRSEELVKATRNWDRKRISFEDLEATRLQDRKDLYELQEGMPFRSSGLFHWDDLIRPFKDIITNARGGALTRFYETNTFWRKLEVDGFQLKEDQIETWIENYFFPEPFQKSDSMVFSLPFLFLFSDYSEGLTLSDIRQSLLTVVKEIDKIGKGMVCFFEPTIGWRQISEEEEKEAKQLIEEIKAICKIPINIVQCFFSLSYDKNFLYRLPIDGIGIDFYANTIKETMDNFPIDKQLLAGVIKTDSTLPEERQQIDHFLNDISQFVSREKVLMTTAGPSELLPRKVMDQKISNMKEIVKCNAVHL